jgi:hypothetical protein
MVWTFARGNGRLEVRREDAADGPLLVVVGGEAPGSTAFADVAALVRHQSRLEATLLDEGWSLLSFEPERRSSAERRAAKRDTFDRRRWWTDPDFRKEQA